MSAKGVPAEMFDIPDNLSPGEFRHVCAQVAIQAIVHAMGSRDVEKGHASMGLPMLKEVMAMATAMLITADRAVTTKKDVREESARCGKLIGGFATILQEQQDTTGVQILDMLGVSRGNLN